MPEQRAGNNCFANAEQHKEDGLKEDSLTSNSVSSALFAAFSALRRANLTASE